MKLLVQLGKLGDIINLLPLALHYNSEGKRIGIMVAKEYADILDGCSYVDKVVFDGPAYELRRAVQEAKKAQRRCCCDAGAGSGQGMRGVDL